MLSLRQRALTASLGSRSVLGIVEAGEPGGEPLQRDFELGIEVDELAHALREPIQGDFLLAPAALEFLDSPVGEIHGSGERRFDDGALLFLVTVMTAHGG